MAILKTAEGLVQLDGCPICGYLVLWTDMDYKSEKPVTCRFCRVRKEERRILRQEGRLRKAREALGLKATTPCAVCGRLIPCTGVFGLPTYTDVPENYAEDCPVREVMEVWACQGDSPHREKE